MSTQVRSSIWSIYKTIDEVILENTFFAHRIRISEILPWDRKSYLTDAVLPRTSSSVIMWNCILAYSGFSGSLFWNKYIKTEVSKKRIHYSCEDRIEKSVLLDHRLSSLLMANGDPWDEFFYPILTLMIDSYIFACWKFNPFPVSQDFCRLLGDLPHLLMFLDSLYCKQYRPTMYFRLIRVAW